MAHDYTIQKLREKIASELLEVGVRDGDDLPVEVWTQRGGREFKILDVIFDDGVISVEVEEING